MLKLRDLKLFLTGVFGLSLLLAMPSVAASSANISHPYHTSGSVPYGSIVSLDRKRSDYIQLANTSNASQITGVAVATNDSLLAVDPNGGTVQVATSGNVNVLVSTLNGNIKLGDQISVSPFNGVGMKSLAGSRVVGLAQTAFDSNTPGAYKQEIRDKSNQASSVWLGYARLSIVVGTDTSGATGGGTQLNSLQKLAKDLTGHIVSTPRVVTSLVIATVSGLALMVLIYASIYGSIISVGRNPLAKYAIFRTLLSVLGMAALVAAVASVTIFWLLR